VSSLGIESATKVTADRTWYMYWRTDGALDYIFVYNDALGVPRGSGFSQGTIEFQSTGKPYLFDAWSGVESPISNYTQSKTSTTIFFRLAGNQSVIVAFKNDESAAKHVTATSAGVISVENNGSSILALVGNTLSTCHTSDGRSHVLAASSIEPITLSSWTLVAEHWDPPSDLADIDVIANKSNTTHILTSLESWQHIAGLQDVSGRGYYSTTFDWEPRPNSGAIIDFGAVVNTLRVSINGHALPPLDPTWAKADITPFLEKGSNRVEAVIATTLINRLRPLWASLRSSGVGPSGSAPSAQDYGLVSDVVVMPYQMTAL
jgi:hypothetical protein